MTTELDYLLGIAEKPDYDLETFVSRAKYFVEDSSRNFLSVRGMLDPVSHCHEGFSKDLKVTPA